MLIVMMQPSCCWAACYASITWFVSAIIFLLGNRTLSFLVLGNLSLGQCVFAQLIYYCDLIP